MSINLSLLPPKEKNKVEIDKQASFLVWKLKQAKTGPEEIVTEMNKIKDESERDWFEQSIEKYKRAMGVG